MDQKRLERELESVVDRVLLLVPEDTPISKTEFECVLGEIHQCLHENAKISLDALARKTTKVLADLPNEYGSLPEDIKAWNTLIVYLYAKYLKELGKLS